MQEDTYYNGVRMLDILSIMPKDVKLYVQAPDLENKIIELLMEHSEYPYYSLIQLNDEKREMLQAQLIEDSSFVDFFQSAEIRKNDELLMEGYDGLSTVILSKKITIPEWFLLKYDETIFSKEW